MERLTSKYWRNLDPWEMCGQDNYCKRGCHDQGGCTKGCIVPRIYARLAAYEVTGLTPEEIKNALDVNDIIPEINVTVDHIRDLLKAEQDGRLVVLPKPSDTDVYIVYYDECGAGGMCLDYPYCDDCKEHTPKIREAKLNYTMVNSIGKTVFLTREEAEEVVARERKRQIQVWIGGEG